MKLIVNRCPGSGWYVLRPRALRGSSWLLIVGLGRVEVGVRRGDRHG